MAGLNQLKRNISDLVNDPRGYLEMVADRMNNSVMGRKAVVNNRGAGMVKMTPGERQEQLQQAMLDNSGSGAMGGALGIIKQKGGNWLNGSVENALHQGLARRTDYGLLRNDEVAKHLGISMEEALDLMRNDPVAWEAARTGLYQKMPENALNAALNRWIEGPLTKYVKRDMATEGDPVRKLAEQGVLHFQPPDGFNSRLVGDRQRAGYPGMGVAKAPMAQSWEGLADMQLSPRKVKEQLRAEYPFNGETMPWLHTLPPDETIYSLGSLGKRTAEVPRDLGFDHLTDELRNALNPESGLPRHLQLTPEQMQQLGMEKAVRHVAAINEWRAAQKAEANAKLSQSPAVKPVRGYAENNPKGLRWVELRQPDALDSATEDQRRQILQDQLKYEGDTMGHCVGGYCDEVASGQSRIFSLRDAKGEPHVTIETRPNLRGLREYLKKFEHPERPGRLEPDALGITDTLHDYVQANRRGNGDYDEFGLETLKRLGHPLPPDSIVQVKGKANLKPKAEYIPFVQDFIRNHPEGGQWGTVGDLDNTGLRQLGNAFNEMERAKLKTLGHDISPTGYATEAEIQALHDAFNSASGEEIPLHMRGFADGGLINKPQVWEPIEADGILGYILR